MNILMMTLMYPADQMEEVTQNAKDKLQYQIHSYQKAFVEGIRSNLKADEKLEILNSLPVGIFPLQYRQLFLQSAWHDQLTLYQLGCINLPFLKQEGRRIAATHFVRNWAKQDPNNRMVLVYTQYLPYMQALAQVKKEIPDLKVVVIITDLPNELGLASGRKGLMKKIEYMRGDQSVALLRKMDGFVLLTDPMAEVLNISHKPWTRIEGLILSDPGIAASAGKTEKPTVLYTGTLEAEQGIGELLTAFEHLPEIQLWICGQGGMRNAVEEAARKHANISYFGFVPQQKALALQASAHALINPRQRKGLFDKYCFPSKTLEYMRSGKPVLCCRLGGIPQDYDPYLNYMDDGAEGIEAAVCALFARPEQERMEQALSARNYVLTEKNPQIQCEKMLRFLRGL